MKQTLLVKLAPTEEQHRLLQETMELFNAGCNTVAKTAFSLHTTGKYRLQELVYPELRAMGLSAQMAIRAISKACDAYKLNKSVQPVFKPHSAMVYDPRILSWKGPDKLSILTLGGRQPIPVKMGKFQQPKIDRNVRQCDLLLRRRTFYLAIIINVPEPERDVATGSLGVDLGVCNLAVDNDGQFHSGEDVDLVRDRLDTLKAALQAKDTKSAKKHLVKLSGRESRFRSSVNHRISKELVSKAKDTHRCIMLEDLGGIGESTVRHSQRRRHKSWAFIQLRTFIEYKAGLAGVLVLLVNPRYTSQECPECHHISKSNRRSQSVFSCRRCGFASHADVVGATNISRRASVNVPIVSPFLSPWSGVGTSPPALAVGG
jgi:IS605 OrfB family transposase